MPHTTESNVRSAIVHTEITIAADRQAVYDFFVNDFGMWFYADENARDETPGYFEAKVGGIVFFKLPDNGFNELARVTMLKPGKKIRLKGDFTMPNAVLANVTIAFEDAAEGTRVAIEHRQIGEFADSDPAEFEAGWYDGLEKLKQLIEAE